MSTTKFSACIRALASLTFLFGAAFAQAQATSSGTDPTADSGIRKDAPSTHKDGSDVFKAAGSVSKGDMNMMRDMAHSNLAEIETGKLALSKSQNPEVKKFAQQMIDDHTQAQAELQKLAQSKGVNLPSKPDKKHQEMAKKMQGMSGEEFDRMYMKQVGVNDHQKTLKLLQKAQKNAKDPDLKALAGKTAPIVEQHLQMAKQHSQAGQGGKSDSKSTSGQGSTTTK